MSDTPRLALPFILPGQAQKEFHHNEALTRLDAAVHAAIEEGPRSSPPSAPASGQSWIAGVGAGGAWTGKDGSLASWTEGGWRFIAPVPGMLVWEKSSSHWLHWRSGSWSEGELLASALLIDGQKVVGSRQPTVPSPSGGTVIDEEARAAIDALTAAIKSHGLIE